MKPIFIVLIITGVLNLFYTVGEGEPLVSFWVLKIYPEGIWSAVFMVLAHRHAHLLHLPAHLHHLPHPPH